MYPVTPMDKGNINVQNQNHSERVGRYLGHRVGTTTTPSITHRTIAKSQRNLFGATGKGFSSGIFFILTGTN
jgi:hypothetical protein